MMLTSLEVTRDKTSYNTLMVTATLRQIIIVSTQATTLPQSSQATPENTAAVQNVGTVVPIAGNPAPGGALPPTAWTAPLKFP